MLKERPYTVNNVETQTESPDLKKMIIGSKESNLRRIANATVRPNPYTNTGDGSHPFGRHHWFSKGAVEIDQNEAKFQAEMNQFEARKSKQGWFPKRIGNFGTGSQDSSLERR